MRIAIDARKLHDFGIGTYIRNVLRGLARLDQQTEYIVLCRPDDVDVAAELGPNFRGVAESARPYSVGEQIPHSAQPGARARPPAARAALRPAAGDTLPLGRDDPRLHPLDVSAVPARRMAHLYARASMWSAVRKSDRILTVSEASKRDILRFFDIPPEKVVVIYNAIDERFLAEPDAEQMDRIRQRYQLDHPFLLYVGNIKPHKNLERLIDAFGRVRAGGLGDLRLVIIGDELSKYPPLRQAVHRHRLDKYVRFLGFQPYDTLAVFYRLARAFVFPSLYEGFGLPPLEAMACGTPVVTSNVSSLPEVAGGAAILVDPYDADSIADGITRAVTDEALRAELIARGLARARDFSWTQSVAAIHRIYMEVLER